ncbi:hypothetical protein [Streptomyces sp. H62]
MLRESYVVSARTRYGRLRGLPADTVGLLAIRIATPADLAGDG